MHCRFSPRRMCNPCGYTMKICSRYHRLLIYNIKRTTEIDGMGPFKKDDTRTHVYNGLVGYVPY